MTAAVRYSLYFGIFLLAFLFIFYHMDLETGKMRAPFTQPPTPTPTLIDQLAMRLWEADGRPDEVGGWIMGSATEHYGDLIAAYAPGCDMSYVEFYDFVVKAAKQRKEYLPHTQHPHLRTLRLLRERKGKSCVSFMNEEYRK